MPESMRPTIKKVFLRLMPVLFISYILAYIDRINIGFAAIRTWIMVRSATDLSKADLHVFSKLFDDGLERGQEAKALSGRQIGAHDDVLDFFVGHLINVGMTRQPAP